MNRNNQGFENDKFSMGISVLIALCVIGIFCAISVVVLENLQVGPHLDKAKHVSLPNSKDIAGLVI
jgi:hypothetical protein